MRILVISDSHGQLDNLNKILREAGKVDKVIHLGDVVGQDDALREMCNCPVTIVKGNCDFYSKNELVEIVEVENMKIFATHGHRFNVEYGINDLCNAAKEEGCSVALYGHTHVPDVSYGKNILVMNPGSISRPRQASGRPTYGILTVGSKGETRADTYSI